MKLLIVTLFIAIGLYSCGRKNADIYYTDHGDWDDVRFPLIKPYEALCSNGMHNWFVQVTPDVEPTFSAPGTRKICINHGIILLYSTETILNYKKAKEAWFVLIPNKHIEKGFATHDEYLNYLHLLHIVNEPKLYEMDKVSAYFGQHDTIDWQRIDY